MGRRKKADQVVDYTLTLYNKANKITKEVVARAGQLEDALYKLELEARKPRRDKAHECFFIDIEVRRDGDIKTVSERGGAKKPRRQTKGARKAG